MEKQKDDGLEERVSKLEEQLKKLEKKVSKIEKPPFRIISRSKKKDRPRR